MLVYKYKCFKGGVMTKEQMIGNALSNYMYPSKGRIQESKDNIRKMIEDPLFEEYIIKKASNKTFRMIVDEFNIPSSVVEKREKLEKNIINNYSNYPVDVVRQALCDLLFHDNLKNVLLTIESIREYAECSEVFNSEYQKLSAVYDVAYDFLSINESDVTIDTMGLFLGDLCEMQKVLAEGGIHLPSATSQLFSLAEKLCEKGFRDDVAECGSRLFDGIEPETVVSASGKEAKMLRLAKQTPNQEKFLFFARSSSRGKWLLGENSRKEYLDNLKGWEYLSYSLLGPGKQKPFKSESDVNINFGYFAMGGGNFLSISDADAQTNQFTIIKGRYNIKQNFLSSAEFVGRHPSHSEILCENIDAPLPDFVISETQVPRDDTIQIANAMNIPIVFIDDRFYKILPDCEHDTYLNSFYDYNEKLKVPLAEMESMTLSQ